MGDVVSYLQALGTVAQETAKDLTTVAEAAGSTREGGSGASGSQAGSSSGPDSGGNNTSGRSGGDALRFGTSTVLPLGAGKLMADLKTLGGRQ